MKKVAFLVLGTGIVTAVVYRKKIISKFNGIRIFVEDKGELSPLEVLDMLRDKVNELREPEPVSEQGSF